jgi:hypothetical protein
VIIRYFSKLKQLLFHPTKYFQSMPLDEPLSHALAFALVTEWIGSAFNYIWMNGIKVVFLPQLEEVFKLGTDLSEIDHPGRGAVVSGLKNQVVEWFFGTGTVLLSPFLSLFKILWLSLIVLIGAKIFLPRSPGGKAVSYDAILRIICLGTAPAILMAIPFLGYFLSGFLTFIITTIGVREYFRVSALRAGTVVSFPFLLLIILFGAFFGMLALAFIKIASGIFV